MRVWRLRLTAVPLFACSLLLVSCTPADTVDPQPSKSASSSKPSESDRERDQRLAFDAVDETYGVVLAERNRLYRSGGSEVATVLLKQNTGGGYLDLIERQSRSAKNGGYRSTANVTVLGDSQLSSYSAEAKTLSFKVCEDFRKVDLKYDNGKIVKPKGTRLYLQKITSKYENGRWRLVSQDSEEIAGGEGRCGQTG